jgi:hypothetical protein
MPSLIDFGPCTSGAGWTAAVACEAADDIERDFARCTARTAAAHGDAVPMEGIPIG